MADDSRSSPPTEHPADHVSLVDAVYEVALDPERYDELVAQWHHELTDRTKLPTEPQVEISNAQTVKAEAEDPLADHFQRATTILERVHPDDWLATGDPLNSRSSVASMPELLLSKTGDVLEANFGATALLSAQAGQHLNSMDLTAPARALLLEFCRQLSPIDTAPPATTAQADPRVLRITRLGDDRPLVVLLSPGEFGDHPALMLRCAEIVWPETLGPLLAQAFGLTSAECEIVQALVAGNNTALIAEIRGTSKETVRTQIRELLAKTGTHSQLELIRMAIGFSMMSQQAEARAGRSPADVSNKNASSASTEAPSEQAQSRLFATATGGNFELVQYGPADGQPVLVFHDEVIGDAFVLPLLRQAPQCRWLVAVRPGFGASTQHKANQKQPSWQQQAEALHSAIAALLPDLTAAPVLAHGNGIFFACQFAKKYPERCGPITSIAASLPGSADNTGVSRYAAFMAGMGKLAPSMLRFAAQAGFAMYARVGTRRFVERVYGDAAIDREVINSSLTMADLEHGSRLTLAQGYRGFLADEQALIEDWTENFVSTPVDVRILIGDEDQPARRKRAEALHGKSERVELINLNSAGFFAAFSATEAVAAALLKP